MKFLILILLVPQMLLARDIYEMTDEEINPSAEEILIKKPEKYLRDESMIYDFNTNLGIKDQRQYTGKDRNRFSVAGHVSGNYEQLTDLLGAEIQYMRRSEYFTQIWYGAQFFQHKSVFDAITQNPTASTAPNSEGSFQRPGDAKNTIMGLGLGVGYRFKLLLDFYPTEDVFESVEVFFNGLQLDESYIDQKYSGYGLTTSYGIHKRSSTSFFYGGKFSYNVASVTRKALGNESKSDRSLSLGWLSLAFEMGFFY